MHNVYLSGRAEPVTVEVSDAVLEELLSIERPMWINLADDAQHDLIVHTQNIVAIQEVPA